MSDLGSVAIEQEVVANGHAGYGIEMSADAQNNVSHCAGHDNDAGNVINCHVGNGCHHNQLP